MSTKKQPQMTAEQVAQRWDCSVATVYRQARILNLTRRRVLGRVLFDADDVERIGKSREQQQRNPGKE